MNHTPALPQRSHACLWFMNRLREQQEAGLFCDLTFELKNKKFSAHKVVVSAWSLEVYSLLQRETSSQVTIRIQYDNNDIFARFLSFLYSGEMDAVAEYDLIQILHLATSLKVSSLRQACEEMLQKKVKIGNIISTFHVARKFHLPNLEEYVMSFMASQSHLAEAVKQDDFLSLSPPKFNSFLSNGFVCVMKPEVKLFLIISWLGYDVQERQQYLMLLLKYIDWTTVANDFLNEIFQTENFFTSDESSLYLLLQTLFSSDIPLGPYMDSFPVLREKYAYLLDNIVQNSFVLPSEVEEYVSLSVELVSPHFHPRQTTSCGIGSDCELRWGSQQPNGAGYTARGDGNQLSFEQADMHDLSNDSVTASIGLQMKNVAIVESQTPLSEEMVLTDYATTSNYGEGQHDGSANRIVDQSDFKRSYTANTLKLSSDSRCVSSSRIPGSSVKERKFSFNSKEQVMKAKGKRKINELEKAGEATEASFVSESKPRLVRTAAQRKSFRRVKPYSECEGPDVSSSVQPKKQPRRQAAANSTVSKKLMPHVCKTKALLKEAVSGPKAIRQGGVDEREAEEAFSEHEDMGRASDSDVDKDDNEGFQEDNDKDPDYKIPEKRARLSKGSNKASRPVKQEVSNVNSNDDVGGKIKDRFTSVKPKVSHTATGSAVADTDSAQTTKQEAESEKAEENKNVKGGPQWKKKCQKCDYSTSTQHRLDNHLKRVHGSRAIVFACTMCQFECEWGKSFYEHFKQHFQGPPYICDFESCEWETEQIQRMLCHRQCHQDQRPFKCFQCSARFRTRNNLIAHFKCHSEEKNHECPVCHRRFKMKNTMEQHLVTHSDARPYLCDTCGFSTKFQSHLISHKRTHTGDVYKCDFFKCSYSTPKRSQLRAHVRSHLRIKKYQCDLCPMKFGEKNHLKRHKKSHLPERPHKCDQCEYSSTRVDKLNEHKRKYHSEEAAKKKRPYKYAPRLKNRLAMANITDRSAKTSSAPPPVSTSSHVPVDISGCRPILPKKKQKVHKQKCLAQLVCAAETLGLIDRVNHGESGQSRQETHGIGWQGPVVPSEMIRGKENIQIAQGVLVKDEVSGIPPRVVHLQEASSDSGMNRTSSHVRSVKHGSGLHLEGHVIADQGESVGGGDTHGGISSITECPYAAQQQTYTTTPHHSHCCPTPLLCLASVSMEMEFASHQSPPHTATNTTQGTMLIPQTALPGVEAASQILMSDIQERNDTVEVSAANSLASPSVSHGTDSPGPEADFHDPLAASAFAQINVDHSQCALHQDQQGQNSLQHRL